MGKNSRRYYYMVHCAPRATKFFIALTKRQIKQYCDDNYIAVEIIFDPSHKPAPEVNYLNISGYKTKLNQK